MNWEIHGETSVVNHNLQMTLWTTPPTESSPPANRTDTSRVAAESIANGAGMRGGRVLAHIRNLNDHGATIDELSADLEMLTATVCGRISELRRAGQIKDSGRRRKTRSDRSAIAWITTEDHPS